jgi:hypothetical protein
MHTSAAAAAAAFAPQVRPHYMLTLRRHRLLARLLGLLQQQAQDTYGSGSVLMLREVWELVARRDDPEYTPLLLYRMVGGYARQGRLVYCSLS